MVVVSEKLLKLEEILKSLGSVLVAFSGGVDSTLLLVVAIRVLGKQVCAVTAASPTFPQSEMDASRHLAETFGVRQIVLVSREMENPQFLANPRNRCYLCKKELFSLFIEHAESMGFSSVVEGSNVDDLSDERPGRKAIEELHVRSPLLEAGFGKSEIRELSRRMGLPTWNKQPLACLASRFPYGSPITSRGLQMVERCEAFLKDQGFVVCRVRHHQDVARIEVGADEISRFLDASFRAEVDTFFRNAGFVHTALDLRGYRTGSMNENAFADIP